MNNTEEIRFKISCLDATIDEVDSFIRSLRAFGCDVATSRTSDVSSVEVAIKYPTAENATRVMKRGGRKAKSLPANSPLKDMDVDSALMWMNEHTSAECAKAMGCSESQYFRRKNKLEDYAAWHYEYYETPVEEALESHFKPPFDRRRKKGARA